GAWWSRVRPHPWCSPCPTRAASMPAAPAWWSALGRRRSLVAGSGGSTGCTACRHGSSACLDWSARWRVARGKLTLEGTSMGDTQGQAPLPHGDVASEERSSRCADLWEAGADERERLA